MSVFCNDQAWYFVVPETYRDGFDAERCFRTAQEAWEYVDESHMPQKYYIEGMRNAIIKAYIVCGLLKFQEISR